MTQIVFLGWRRWVMLLLAAGCAFGAERRISMAELRDKVEGGWAGQMFGVGFGEPTEFRSLGKIIEGDLPEWKPEMVRRALTQDDLYVDMTFAQVLDDKGLQATTEDFGQMFRNSQYPLWHANLAARRNLLRGVPASESGNPQNNAHSDDIDFQIESDFIGMMAPGLPKAATDIAWRAGRVMNYGDGLYGGVYVSCMYAAAFFEKEPVKVVKAGLACLPKESRYAKVIGDVLAAHAKDGKDWRGAWKMLDAKWDRRDSCPLGAASAYNIDAALNGAYIALGLLFGEGDFDKTIDIATRAGQDSDCNPSSAAGILGVMTGYKAIPEKWKGGIAAVENEKFQFTNYTFRTIVESTMKRAVALVKTSGGKVEGETVVVKEQAPEPPLLEQFHSGKVKGRFDTDDGRWKFDGSWRREETQRRDVEKIAGRRAVAKGAEVTATFQGTGVILAGTLSVRGGTADVYLDGRLHKTVDAYHADKGMRAGESIWHAFSLAPGEHTVRLVLRGERYPESYGTEIFLSDLIIFE